jgi:hypothetical protein
MGLINIDRTLISGIEDLPITNQFLDDLEETGSSTDELAQVLANVIQASLKGIAALERRLNDLEA